MGAILGTFSRNARSMALFSRPRARVPVFIELCAGSAALSCILTVNKRPPVSWMGCKVGWADSILSEMGLLPEQGADRVVLVDPGPWGAVWDVLRTEAGRGEVIQHLTSWFDVEPEPFWLGLKKQLREKPLKQGDPVIRVAQWLYLFNWSVYARDAGGYCGPGKVTKGGNKPYYKRLPTLCNDIAALRFDTDISAFQCSATEIPIPDSLPSGSVVYIDPPYLNTSGYLKGVDLQRDQAVNLALAWHKTGARVVVSEGEPMPIPGARVLDITDQRIGIERVRALHLREFLTILDPR